MNNWNYNDLIVITYPNKEAFILANRRDDRERVTNVKSVFKILNDFKNPLMRKYIDLSADERQELEIVMNDYISSRYN